MKTKRSASGFTLLEVLVALGIVAIIAILSWRGLTEVLRSTSRVTEVDNAVQTTVATFAQLERDLASLNLGSTAQPEEADLVQLSSSGLLLRATHRESGEKAYREEVQWTLTDQGLVRSAKRESEDRPPVFSDPIAVTGLQIRLLRESGEWSNPLQVGNYIPLNNNDVALQGNALARAGGSTAPEGGEGAAAAEDKAKAEDKTQVRAVEFALTQSNRQTVLKVLLTGGAY